MNFSKIILSLIMMTIFVNCSMNNDAKISQLPEIINQDTGLRELRFRRYDCLHLTPNEVTAACTDNEEIKPEAIKPEASVDTKKSTKAPDTKKTAVAPLTEPNLRVNELTPWLDTRARTVVNPTVMYNYVKSEVDAVLYLRMYDSATSQFKDFKYEFKADIKSHKESFQRTRKKQYLNFTRTKAESKEVLNVAAYCYDNPTCKDITLVVTFLNFTAKGDSFIDSRPFQIDQREPELKPNDGVPAKAVRSVDQPVYEEEQDSEDTDGEATMDAYDPEEPTHTDDAFSQSPIGPVLSTDNIDSFCVGLISDSEVCPKYLLDPTLPKPKSASEETAVRESSTDTVELIRTSPKKETNNSGKSEPEIKDQEIPNIRPKPRPKNLVPDKPVDEEVILEPVDAIDEQVFPDEKVILEDVVRQPEENIDLLPATKNYNPSDYHQFFLRMKIQQELAKSEANKQTTPIVITNNDDQASQVNIVGGITSSQRPKARPDGLGKATNLESNTIAPQLEDIETEEEAQTIDEESSQGLKSSPRPKPRPDNLGQAAEAASAKVAPFVSVDGKFTYDLSLCGEHAVKAKNIKYYQSRGYYARRGSINKSSHYVDSDYDTNHIFSGRSSTQYASELTKQVIEFAGCVLEQRYGSKLETFIKDLSAKNGGKLGRHSSHQNGLDADISYPHLNGKTTGFDNFAGNMTTERTVAALDLARIMIYSDRVHVLFTDNRIRTKFCSYLKSSNKLSNYREIVERYMYHVGGHHNHYHVRMKCNSQNEGCEAQAQFANTRYCGK